MSLIEVKAGTWHTDLLRKSSSNMPIAINKSNNYAKLKFIGYLRLNVEHLVLI